MAMGLEHFRVAPAEVLNEEVSEMESLAGASGQSVD
jgi:hypothetical protein